MNGMSGEVIDGSGTINPAALNTAGMGFGCLFMFSYLFLPLTPLAQICFSQWLNDDPIVSDAFPFFAKFLMLTCSLLIASLSAPTAAPSNLSPRGIKRSRSPDGYGDAGLDGDHEDRTYIPLLLIIQSSLTYIGV